MLPGTSVFVISAQSNHLLLRLAMRRISPLHMTSSICSHLSFCTLQNSVQDSCQVVGQQQSMLMKDKS